MDGLKDDRGGGSVADEDIAPGLDFQPIDPQRPILGSGRVAIVTALDEIDRVARDGTSARQRLLASETLARIQSGDVLIGGLEHARGPDLWHMCRDLEGATCPIAYPEDPAWAAEPILINALHDGLAGYTWGNRLYFNLDAEFDVQFLAATLVHEVNHALNRSECSYYADYFDHVIDPTLAFLEEYRAFVAECIFKRGRNATAARCDTAAHVQLDVREYGLAPDLSQILDDPSKGTRIIAESLFAGDGAFGLLIPTADSWPVDFDEWEIDLP